VFVPVGRSRKARVSSCVFTVLGTFHLSCFSCEPLGHCRVTGKRGLCLATPCLFHSENHTEIERVLLGILDERKRAFGEAGCPSAIVTDKVTRDHNWLTSLLSRLFPVAMSREETKTAICQDIIHRVWAFTRVIPKHHPDCMMASRDIKSIFGRFT
jgi:ferredoxin-thioredoxin reductase catalytic subunit